MQRTKPAHPRQCSSFATSRVVAGNLGNALPRRPEKNLRQYSQTLSSMTRLWQGIMEAARRYTQGHRHARNLMTTIATPTLLNKAAVCALLGLSPRCLENMVKNQDFPPPVRMGKHVYWSEAAVNRWIKEAFASQEAWSPSLRVSSASLSSSRCGTSSRFH